MVFVVGEIGVNWDGDYNLLEEMMEKSKKLGCNAVKFQAFNESNLGDHPEKSRLLKSAISEENVRVIDSISKKIGIEWFCTPMYKEAVDFLKPYVKRFKIRELDGRNLLKNEISPLLKKVLDSGKEIIISSETPPNKFIKKKFPKIKWIYCIPKYPCKLEDFNFDEITKFEGFSNHCPDLQAPLKAAESGIEIIELHLTNDKSKDFFDNNVSFDFAELKQLMLKFNKIK